MLRSSSALLLDCAPGDVDEHGRRAPATIIEPVYTLIDRADQALRHLSTRRIAIVAGALVALVALADYLTGFLLSLSVFYLAPVSLAAWYAGRVPAVLMALLACLSWLAADIGAGHVYEHEAIAVWNALVRLGFFLVNGLLLAALRESLYRERDLARIDPLTGAYTRRAFNERLAQNIEWTHRHKSALTLLYIDLDDFKRLNDERGHAAGDQALCATARLLQGRTRRVDTVARLGGDEFAVVLSDTDRHGAEQAVTKLRADLLAALAAFSPGLGASIGVLTCATAPASVESVLAAADRLMYSAKRTGKNRVVYGVAPADPPPCDSAAAPRTRT